jgi:hypothetical protein
MGRMRIPDGYVILMERMKIPCRIVIYALCEMLYYPVLYVKLNRKDEIYLVGYVIWHEMDEPSCSIGL